ncbi:hypothetical protein [Nonomuraea sp. NPDC049695]|uniref:hypothetical protein n=1 Tax=Nonomuraea sp. NPDC049695 TaxID=3154734 RepID=UPI00342745FB
MALFLFESRRLVRSPLLWGTAVPALLVCLLWNQDLAFDAGRETAELPTVMLLLAAGTAYAACLAVSRDQRHGMPVTLGALPVQAGGRTLAVLLAASTVAAATAALVTVTCLLGRWAASGTAAGRPDLFDALTGVGVAAFAAALGTAAGRWVPSLFAGPLTITFGAGLQVMGNILWNYLPGGEWLAPVNPLIDLPLRPASRPTGWHLAYLAGLAVALGALALRKHGTSRWQLVAAVAALAVAVPSAVVMTRTGGRIGGAPPPGHCRDLDGVRYCAYEDYLAWIPEWARTLRPVLAAAPPAARARLTEVRQSDSVPAAPGTVHAGTVWGKASQRRLAGEAAALMTGLTPRRPAALVDGPAQRQPAGGEPVCDASGQARAVVALWLMGQTVRLDPPAQLGDAVQAGTSDLALARRLLGLLEAGKRIRAHWATLVDPGTTTRQALPLLGLQPERTVTAGQPGRRTCG